MREPNCLSLYPSCAAALAAAALLFSSSAEAGVSLRERPRPGAAYSVEADVSISGTVLTPAGKGQQAKLPLTARAVFRFDEVSPDDGVTEPAARRVLRVYRTASAQTKVGDFETNTQLPAALARVVVAGRSEGPVRYSLDGLMTREAVDLLDMPGDPLALAAAMPAREIEVNEEFEVPEWAAQMLCGVDVLSRSTLKGKLLSGGSELTVSLSGVVEGARLGAAVTTRVSGKLRLSGQTASLLGGEVTYAETAAIGTITPGVELSSTVRLSRRPSSVAIDTSDMPAAISPAALKLYLDAPTWGVRMMHDRDWHVFHADPTGEPPVVILRLIDGGKLLSQVNVAKLRRASAGQGASIEEFESDIRTSLGTRFEAIVDRVQKSRPDGVAVSRVVASGNFNYTEQVGSEKVTKSRPMLWSYYLLVHPDGRQLSAVFANEPDAQAALKGRDEDLIDRIEFFAPRIAANN